MLACFLPRWSSHPRCRCRALRHLLESTRRLEELQLNRAKLSTASLYLLMEGVKVSKAHGVRGCVSLRVVATLQLCECLSQQNNTSMSKLSLVSNDFSGAAAGRALALALEDNAFLTQLDIKWNMLNAEVHTTAVLCSELVW